MISVPLTTVPYLVKFIILGMGRNHMHNVLNLFKDIWFSMVLVRSCHAAVKVELVATSRMRMLDWGGVRVALSSMQT